MKQNTRSITQKDLRHRTRRLHNSTMTEAKLNLYRSLSHSMYLILATIGKSCNRYDKLLIQPNPTHTPQNFLCT